MEEITVLLRDLATQLGVTVEYLWPFLVKQTIVSWFSCFVGGLFAVIVGFIGVKKGIPMQEGSDVMESWGNTFSVAGFIFMLIGMIILLITLCNLDCVFAAEAVTFNRLIMNIS